MTDIQRFTHAAFGAIRTLSDDHGRVLFCGRDVATDRTSTIEESRLAGARLRSGERADKEVEQ